MARRAKPEARESDKKTAAAYYARKRQDPEWVSANSQYRRMYVVRRRAIKQGADGHFTASQWRDLCAKHDHRCAYCGQKARLTVDHAVPLSRGGTNFIDNILPACSSCNSRKHTKTADEFMSAVASP